VSEWQAASVEWDNHDRPTLLVVEWWEPDEWDKYGWQEPQRATVRLEWPAPLVPTGEWTTSGRAVVPEGVRIAVLEWAARDENA
jgi:hypothetical protein